jgi:hypothetical protein
MRNLRGVAWLLMVVVCASGATAASAATVYFQDGFENEPVSATGAEPIGPPDVGVSWTQSPGSGARGVDIVASPAVGTRSMRLLREPAPPFGPSNGQANGLSLPGAIVDGNLLEVKWSNRLSTEGPVTHRFNAPMQMSIGHAGSNYDNDLAFILVNDPNNGAYAYSNSTAQYGNLTSSNTLISLDAWDTLRAVLSLTQVDATTMGGTYDLFVSLAGGPEQQLANDALLSHTTIPAGDPSSMQLRISKGLSTSVMYYDDISVTQVPEPSALGLSAVACGLLAVRRRRNLI